MVEKVAAAAYLKTQVETASPEQLVTMLYDGAVRFGEQAVDALGRDDSETFCARLGRVQDIVLELSASLDRERGGEISGNLASLYSYVYTRLVEADITRDVALVREALGIIRELREGWIGALENIRQPGASPVAG